MFYTIKINSKQPGYQGTEFDRVIKLDDGMFEGHFRTPCGRIFLEEEVDVIEARQLTPFRHGGPYDRGDADAYYGRQFRPHYFEGATSQSQEITDLTEEQHAEYCAGFNENPSGQKDWG